MTGGSAARRELIVIVSGSSYRGVYRAERGLAEALSGHYDILFVDPPVSPITNRRAGRPAFTGGVRGYAEEAPGIHLLKPMVLPGKDRPFVRRTTAPLMRRAVQRVLDADGRTPVALVQVSPHHSVLGHVDAGTSVYWASDDFTAGAGLIGVDKDYLAAYEESVARSADVVLAVSQAIADRWGPIATRVEVFPNGVAVDAFATLPQQGPIIEFERPAAAVVGTLSERIDLGLLERVSDAGVDIVLIGPRLFRHENQRFDDLIGRPNVHWIGEVPFEALPWYYAHVDIGLVPYARSEFNIASFPLKTLEYLAAGLPVVSTDLPQIGDLDSPDARAAGTDTEFVDAVVSAARSGSTDDDRARRQKFAAGHSWAERARYLAELLGI